jgi:thymidylate kinase
MQPNPHPNNLIVIEGIDGVGKTTACDALVQSLNHLADKNPGPPLGSQAITDIITQIGASTEIADILGNKRPGGAVQIDTFPFPNPISLIDKRRFEDTYGIDFGAHLYILSALFKDKTIRALLPFLHVVCDRYIYSLIAKHRALGENPGFFNYESLPVIRPDLFYLLRLDETERKRRVAARGNPTAFDYMPNIPGSRHWKIDHELEKLGPTIIDTTHQTHDQIVKKILSDLGQISPRQKA